MHPPPSPARSRCIWTCPSVPAIPAPRAVWPTTGPKGHPSGWLVHPLSAHHHLPSPSGTLCMRACMRSESGRISAFGHVCPSLPAILEEFSPQTSPSGIIYPMVGVPSMCPPHPFSHFPTSGHPCGPAFLPTWPLHGLRTTSRTLLCTSAHPCAPSRTPAHLCASPFLGLSPLSDFPLTSDPLLATMGNPALVQLGTAPIPDLCITKSKPCGPHATHLPSLWACTTHIAIQGSGPAGSPVAKAAPIFHCGKPCNRLTNYSIPWPMGREILLSGQDSDLLSLGAYEGSALRGG